VSKRRYCFKIIFVSQSLGPVSVFVCWSSKMHRSAAISLGSSPEDGGHAGPQASHRVAVRGEDEAAGQSVLAVAGRAEAARTQVFQTAVPCKFHISSFQPPPNFKSLKIELSNANFILKRIKSRT